MVRQIPPVAPDSAPPDGIFHAASLIQKTLLRLGFRFCFIGGLALQRWANPRYTQDVDLTLICPIGEEISTTEALIKTFQSRISDPLSFSPKSRVFLAQMPDGTPADIALGILDFEVRAVERAVMFDFGIGDPLRICTASDLVVMKAFAARDRDWIDIASIVTRQHDKLDWAQIYFELRPLVELKEEPEILDKLQKISLPFYQAP